MRPPAERLRIVLGLGAMASYPEGGGVWAGFLQFLLGFVDLGHEVLWIELLRSRGDASQDMRLVAGFFRRMREFGLDDRCVVLIHEKHRSLLTLDSVRVCGLSRERLVEVCRTSDVLLNFAAALPPSLLSLFSRRAFIDGDPGHLQVSALEWDVWLDHHEVLLTVGTHVHQPGCEIPTLGRRWIPFLPPVHLPMWPQQPDPGPMAPFSSVTAWNWEELLFGGKRLSISKREAYLRYRDLPRRTGRPFRLAANIGEGDESDIELLTQLGWEVCDPGIVASMPARYRDFISASRGELSCPKPIYRQLKTGWVSDRTACYLASGRPVVAEETGFSSHIPTGAGLRPFHDLEGAVEAVLEVDRDYERHRRGARLLAEELFDARKVLPVLLAKAMAN